MDGLVIKDTVACECTGSKLDEIKLKQLQELVLLGAVA
jgi:hypothetical protein